MSHFPNDNSRFRVFKDVKVIESDDGDIEFINLEKTELMNAGSIITTRINTERVINGQKINNPAQIKGSCSSCSVFLTRFTFRFCSCCFEILCPKCVVRDSKDDAIFCSDCFKKIRRKRFWSGLWNLFSSLFVERIEDEESE